MISMATSDEVRVVVADDDNASVSSFDSFESLERGSRYPRPSRHAEPPAPRMPLIDGKIPDVLYVLRYFGRYDRLVEGKSSTLLCSF